MNSQLSRPLFFKFFFLLNFRSIFFVHIVVSVETVIAVQIN